MLKPEDVFSTFPKFTPLSYEHKDCWNELIADYPPISDYSFATLMNWWSSLEDCKVAALNGNIVISYWIPGDEVNSGLSIIGRRKLDESICTIFDWQKMRGVKPRLVHVPEFVIESVTYHELFLFRGNRSYDECILAVDKYSSLDTMPIVMRSKTRRFLTHYESKNLDMRELMINDQAVKREITVLNNRWKRKKRLNTTSSFENDCFINAVVHAERMGVKGLGFYLDGLVHSVCLFTVPSDERFINLSFVRHSYEMPGLFEVFVFEFAKFLSKENIQFVNIDNDLGDPVLRATKIALGAKSYFRKYSITPST